MDIEILRFRPLEIPGEKSAGLAVFNANVNGFGIRSGMLRRHHERGELFVETVRNERGKGITLQRGPVRDELTTRIVELYKSGATI